MKKSGASCKTLQLYKVVYSDARVVTKFDTTLTVFLRVGCGTLEGGVNSPIFFIFGLETVFREADELSKSLALSGGIMLCDTAYDQVVFADDVTITVTGGAIDDLTHRLQILELSSLKAGLATSHTKSCLQHIGHSGDALAVTSRDIQALKTKFECPKSWYTRRFTSAAEVREHVVWHDTREGGRIDQAKLATGYVVAARGPPEHRFFLVYWATGEFKWLLHKSFTPQTQHLIDTFFYTHFHLDRDGTIRGGSGEAR